MEEKLALIGFGEAASTFARLAKWGQDAVAWDIAPERGTGMQDVGVVRASVAAEAFTNASLALSLVTADQALRAATDYAPLLRSGSIWCDMNSVAPETKCASARVVEECGGRYVDVAVLAPVNPAGLVVPLLVSGPDAVCAEAALRSVGFNNVRVVGSEVGKASAIKMIRSVMVKGIEALTDEMMAAAEAAGVTEEVLASLDASERMQPWHDRAAYNLERMASHGTRRAAEMEESAKTLASLGVDPVMTRGTIVRQRQAGEAA